LKRPLNGHLKLAINGCIVLSVGRPNFAHFARVATSVLHMTNLV
jgi:hypothetical protein